MAFESPKSLVLELIIGFLKDIGLKDTVCVMTLESGIGQFPLNTEMNYLQKLTLQGRWTDVLNYIEPFRNTVHDFNRVEFLVRRQYFFELLACKTGDVLTLRRGSPSLSKHPEGEGEGDIDMKAIIDILKSMEPLCTADEFSSICSCLGLRSLKDSKVSAIAHWDVSGGRLECFDAVFRMLRDVIPGPAVPALGNGLGLLTMLALALTAQTPDAHNIPAGPVEVVRSEGILSPIGASQKPRRTLPTLILRDTAASLSSPHSVHVRSPVIRNTVLSQPRSQPSPKDRDRDRDHIHSSHSQQATVRSHAAGNGNGEGEGRRPAVPVAVAFLSEQSDKVSQDRTGGNKKLSEEKVVAAEENMKLKIRYERSDIINDYDNDSKSRDGGSGSGSGGGVGNGNSNYRRYWRTRLASACEPIPQEIFSTNSPLRALVVIGPAGTNDNGGGGGGRNALVAVGSNDRTLRLLHRTSSSSAVVAREWAELHKGSIFTLAWSGSGANANSSTPGVTGVIASGSNDKTVRITRSTTGPPLIPFLTFPDLVFLCQRVCHILSLANSHAQYLTPSLVLKGHTGTIRSLQFQSHSHSNSSSSSGTLLASGGAGDCAVRLWDISRGSLVSSLSQPASSSSSSSSPCSPVHGVVWLDQGRLVVAASEEGALFCFDTRTASVVWTVALPQPSGRGGQTGTGTACLSSTVTDSDELLAAGNTDGSVVVVSSRERRVLLAEKLHDEEIRCVGMRSQGSTGRDRSNGFFMLTASSDCTGGLWHMDGADKRRVDQMARFRGHSDKLLNASFVSEQTSNAPLGDSILTTGAD
eukprot:gene10053-20944_t